MAGATPSAVAGIYAQALIDLAEERGKRPAVVDDCRELARVLTEDASILAGLEDPRVGKERAKLALAEGLGTSIQKETLDLVRLLIDRNRLRDLPAIAREAVRLAERAAGVVHIAATTATELSPSARSALDAGLKRAFGPGVVLHAAVDAGLIGGVTLRVDDTFVDGSVRRQLSEMKNVILNAPVDQRLWEGVSA
ncbi:MAG: ATP synthase F1 subunit delta [Planctomycetes bacterium]|nr:ATP synthase F1 subunit delta [Planctomycetota bacterium]